MHCGQLAKLIKAGVEFDTAQSQKGEVWAR